ncbi:MAG: XdhC family protein [Chloroflexi bacterium]|nr:XdhC family protein [Chloroflexota bacterium]MCL5075856.1 XdhC family protein [Chloroflexota bacterium]
MKEIFEEIAAHVGQGETVALATVTRSLGSTPRKPGAKMLIFPDGKISGSIGGGCGEAEVWAEAMEAIKTKQPRLVTVDLTQDITSDSAMICGGIMEVFVEPIGLA